MGDGYRLGTLPKMILLGVIIFPPSIFDLGYFVALTRLGRALQFQKYRHAWDRFVRATICDSSGISVWRVTLLWGLQFLYVYILMRRRQCMFRHVVKTCSCGLRNSPTALSQVPGLFRSCVPCFVSSVWCKLSISLVAISHAMLENLHEVPKFQEFDSRENKMTLNQVWSILNMCGRSLPCQLTVGFKPRVQMEPDQTEQVKRVLVHERDCYGVHHGRKTRPTSSDTDRVDQVCSRCGAHILAFRPRTHSSGAHR